MLTSQKLLAVQYHVLKIEVCVCLCVWKDGEGSCVKTMNYPTCI